MRDKWPQNSSFPSNESRHDRIYAVPRSRALRIDGELSGWDLRRQFRSECRGEFAAAYYLKAAVMYDDEAHRMLRSRDAKREESHEKSANPVAYATFATSGESQLLATKGLSGEAGIRTYAPNPENSSSSNQSGAESGALDGQIAPLDPELAAVVAAWPTLPVAIKAAIVALAKSSSS